MKTRQLLRSDLPQNRRSTDSLNIPVLFNGVKRFICDIHFANQDLCYLENYSGVPVELSGLKLIIEDRKDKILNKRINGKLRLVKQLIEDILKLRVQLNRK